MHRTPTETSATVGIIPARWDSSRFPGKPLHFIAGKPLVQHVFDQCRKCPSLQEVIIATDDDRIAKAAREFGATVAMTASDHPSGTDRIAEVAEQFPQYDTIINVQGDEPLVSPALITELVEALHTSGSGMVTAAGPIDRPEDISDPNIVKVVLNGAGDALYFSRSPIPFRRSEVPDLATLRHHGIYGFRRDCLLRFVEAPPAPLELAEGLEQLRALHLGERIQVVITGETSVGIDTPEQAKELETFLSQTSPPSAS